MGTTTSATKKLPPITSPSPAAAAAVAIKQGSTDVNDPQVQSTALCAICRQCVRECIYECFKSLNHLHDTFTCIVLGTKGMAIVGEVKALATLKTVLFETTPCFYNSLILNVIDGLVGSLVIACYISDCRYYSFSLLLAYIVI